MFEIEGDEDSENLLDKKDVDVLMQFQVGR